MSWLPGVTNPRALSHPSLDQRSRRETFSQIQKIWSYLIGCWKTVWFPVLSPDVSVRIFVAGKMTIETIIDYLTVWTGLKSSHSLDRRWPISTQTRVHPRSFESQCNTCAFATRLSVIFESLWYTPRNLHRETQWQLRTYKSKKSFWTEMFSWSSKRLDINTFMPLLYCFLFKYVT